MLEVVAIRTITPQPEGSSGIAPEKREAGKAKAHVFALEYLASFPPAVRDVMTDRYGTQEWEGKVAEGYLNVSAGFAWDVTVSCMDIQREWAVARRVMGNPEEEMIADDWVDLECGGASRRSTCSCSFRKPIPVRVCPVARAEAVVEGANAYEGTVYVRAASSARP